MSHTKQPRGLHPCERHGFIGSLDLGPCTICSGTGWVEWAFCPPQECPNAKDRQQYYEEAMSKRIPNTTPTDHFVFPPDHGLHDHIIYDSEELEYYNIKIDIFLSDDDIAFHKLRPYTHITSPLPSPTPENYFTHWTEE